MRKFKQLINPHSHSDGSLDGASTIESIVKRNLELGATHVAATEHGNLNTSIQLYHTCKKNNVKPILGIELYLQPPFIDEIEKAWRNFFSNEFSGSELEDKVRKEIANEYVHLTVHFKDEWAYNYFCSLTPKMEERAVVKVGERKPIATIDEVAAAHGHVTICSSCLVGAVQKWTMPKRYKRKHVIMPPRLDLAEKAYHLLRDIAGPGNFFIEIFPHQVTHEWVSPKIKNYQIITEGFFQPNECLDWSPDGDIQKPGNLLVLDLARKNNDPVIISLDSHFSVREDKIVQDAKLGNGQERWRFYNSYHISDTDEAAADLISTLKVTHKDIEKWVDNSYMFASLFDNFKLQTNKDRWVLEPLAADWMMSLKSKIDRYGRMNWSDPAMVSRLKKEIDILSNNGKINLMSYFFTVEDIANFCKSSGILMNVRGSAGGSLLLYLLGVSAFNPLKHELSFERFLTQGRIIANTLPDVDMDVSDQAGVFKYLEDKYGDRFSRISVDIMLKLKSSIKDAERSVNGSVSKETEEMCKKLPNSQQGVDEFEAVFGYDEEDSDGTMVHHKGLVDTNQGLQSWIANNQNTWEIVKRMLATSRQKSVHACGAVIADKPVQEYCPVMVIDETKATGLNPKSVELAGLVKYDLLSVNTLRDIQLCVQSIKDHLNIDIDPWDLPYDEKCFKAFSEGKTVTVFQFNTDTVVPYLKKIKPTSIEDLANITSLCRPGTLDALSEDGRTLAEVFVARSAGEPITYIHPDLEPIMKNTLGVQLFQEQTLKIFKDLAGYSDEQTETARRGIGKKEKAVLESCMGDLRKGCYARGWTEKQVNLLIDQIMASARYSFNKSHAISYGYVAYACMYLKENYPLHWWKACLTNADKNEFTSVFWRHIKDIVLLPDISSPQKDYTIEGSKLRAPISILNGLGEKGFDQLVSHAPYSSFENFIEVNLGKRSDGTRSSINSTIVQEMIVSGMLDKFFPENTANSVKLEKYAETYAAVRKEKVKPIDEKFQNISSLGYYLIKKQLVQVYSEDLRPMMLPSRGGKESETGGGNWKTSDMKLVVDGSFLQNVENNSKLDDDDIKKRSIPDNYTFCCIGYVIDEKALVYKNKTKQATKMVVDINGYFTELVLWPSYNSDKSPVGFKKKPCLLVFSFWKNRCNLKHVEPLLTDEQMKRYDVV